jgi:hypothetical protein
MKKVNMVASTVSERVASALPGRCGKEGVGEEQEHAPRRQESAHENAGRREIEMRIARRRKKLALHLPPGKRGRTPMCTIKPSSKGRL